jgi:predicted NBD/HSP70 family sugar kinase
MRDLFVVADLGGTCLRSGYVEPGASHVEAVCREPVHGRASAPGADVESLQRRVVAQLVAALVRLVDDAPEPVVGIAVAFAGPVDAGGHVSDAPTVWGPRGPRLALATVLSDALARPVEVLNDVTAAGCRYVEQEREDFCVVTVSSGLGNKVFRDGVALLHPLGLGGEIGHLRVDRSAAALRCDCGEQGHLAAIASGRGVLNCTRRAAARSPQRFRCSKLHDICGGDPAALASEHVAEAIRDGDVFAADVLRIGLAHLASVLATISAAVGVRRFILIGGFARAVGAPYLEHLGEQLRELGCCGIATDEVTAMLRLGEPDDDDGLLGCARHLERIRVGEVFAVSGDGRGTRC